MLFCFTRFPNDPNTYGIDRQFMWGSGLLITPVVEKGDTSVQAYFPGGEWYDYYTVSTKFIISTAELRKYRKAKHCFIYTTVVWNPSHPSL